MSYIHTGTYNLRCHDVKELQTEVDEVARPEPVPQDHEEESGKVRQSLVVQPPKTFEGVPKGGKEESFTTSVGQYKMLQKWFKDFVFDFFHCSCIIHLCT